MVNCIYLNRIEVAVGGEDETKRFEDKMVQATDVLKLVHVHTSQHVGGGELIAAVSTDSSLD